MDKIDIYRKKKCKNPSISYWKQLEREKRKKTGKATTMVVVTKKTILSFN